MLRRLGALRCAFRSSAFPPKESSEPLFDGCFVLNLDRRPDRWQHVEEQIDTAKLASLVVGNKIERVSGIDGSSLNIDKLVEQGAITRLGARRYAIPLEEKLFGMDLTAGAIGCALSHRKIWEMVVARKLRRALVLEDDVELAPRFFRNVRERLAVVPGDYGLLYLGGLDLLSSGKPPRPFIAKGVRYAYEGHRELTAYVIHELSARRCLELSLPMTWQIDTHITSLLTEDPRVPIPGGVDRPYDRYISDPLSYVLQPALAIQVTSFGTDVQKSPAANPPMEDASRRMREFVGGCTSVR